MMSSLVLDDQALVTLDALEDGRLFDRPVADIGPLLLCGLVVLLLGVRGLPPCLPVVSELF